MQLGRVRAVRRALTRARAALAQATAVRWVVPAVARCHAVAPGHATRPWVLPGFVVAVVWAQQLADEIQSALRQGAERLAAQRALARPRPAPTQATEVPRVVRAVGRFHAVAPGHATRPWAPPGFVVAVVVVLAQQLADEVQVALRQGPVPAERLVALRRAWAALTVVAAPASPVPVEQLAARRTLARPCVAVAQAVRGVVRVVGRFHADPPYRAVPEAALPAPLVGSAAGRPGACLLYTSPSPRD